MKRGHQTFSQVAQPVAGARGIQTGVNDVGMAADWLAALGAGGGHERASTDAGL